MLRTVLFRAVALCAVGLMGSVLDAQAQPAVLFPSAQQNANPPGRRLPALPAFNAVLVPKTLVMSETLAASLRLQTPVQRCRRGRRAWIGALVGAGAAAPLAILVHRRWENEAANGDTAAATTVALGAAAGAFIGLATCE